MKSFQWMYLLNAILITTGCLFLDCGPQWRKDHYMPATDAKEWEILIVNDNGYSVFQPSLLLAEDKSILLSIVYYVYGGPVGSINPGKFKARISVKKPDGTRLPLLEDDLDYNDIILKSTVGKSCAYGKNWCTTQYKIRLHDVSYNYLTGNDNTGVQIIFHTYIDKDDGNGLNSLDYPGKWLPSLSNVGMIKKTTSCKFGSKTPSPATGLQLEKDNTGVATGRLIWNKPTGVDGTDYDMFKLLVKEKIEGSNEYGSVLNADGYTIKMDCGNDNTCTNAEYDKENQKYSCWLKKIPFTKGADCFFELYTGKSTGCPDYPNIMCPIPATVKGGASWEAPDFTIISSPAKLPLSIIKEISYTLNMESNNVSTRIFNAQVEPEIVRNCVRINLNPVSDNGVSIQYGTNQTLTLQVIEKPANIDKSVTLTLHGMANVDNSKPITVIDAIKFSKAELWTYLPHNTPKKMNISIHPEVPENRVFIAKNSDPDFYFCENDGTQLSHYAAICRGSTTIQSWTYATEAERLAASGFTGEDIMKIGLQESNTTYYVLKALPNTWEAIKEIRTDQFGLGETFIIGSANENAKPFAIELTNRTPAGNYQNVENGYGEYEFGLPAAQTVQFKARDITCFDSLHFAFISALKSFNVTKTASSTNTKIRVKTLFGYGEAEIRKKTDVSWASEVALSDVSTDMEIRGKVISNPRMPNIRVEIVEGLLEKVVYYEDIEVSDNVGIRFVPFIVKSTGASNIGNNAVCMLVEAASNVDNATIFLGSTQKDPDHVNTDMIYAEFIYNGSSLTFQGYDSPSDFQPGSPTAPATPNLAIDFSKFSGVAKKRYIPIVESAKTGPTLPGVWATMRTSTDNAYVKYFKVYQNAGIEHFDCVLSNLSVSQTIRRKIYIGVDENSTEKYKFRFNSQCADRPSLYKEENSALKINENTDLTTGYYWIDGGTVSILDGANNYLKDNELALYKTGSALNSIVEYAVQPFSVWGGDICVDDIAVAINPQFGNVDKLRVVRSCMRPGAASPYSLSLVPVGSGYALFVLKTDVTTTPCNFNTENEYICIKGHTAGEMQLFDNGNTKKLQQFTVANGTGIQKIPDLLAGKYHQVLIAAEAVSTVTKTDAKVDIVTYVENDAWSTIGSLSSFYGYDWVTINPRVISTSTSDKALIEVKYSTSIKDQKDFAIGGFKITKVDGLYNKDGAYDADYLFDDNDGKVFINNSFEVVSGVVTPKWSPNEQFINITAETVPTGIQIPDLMFLGIKIRWSYEDPDDRSDNTITGNQNFKNIIDPNGDEGNDNLGERNGAVWQQLSTSYKMTLSTDDKSAETEFKNGKTEVRFNATDVGGDNFIIKYKYVLDNGWTGTELKTNEFAAWKLLHVQSGYMSDCGGKVEQLDNLNESFKNCFVHFDILPSQAMADMDLISTQPEITKAALQPYFTGNNVPDFVFVAFARNVTSKYFKGRNETYENCEIEKDHYDSKENYYAGRIMLPPDPVKPGSRKKIPTNEIIRYITIKTIDNKIEKSFLGILGKKYDNGGGGKCWVEDSRYIICIGKIPYSTVKGSFFGLVDNYDYKSLKDHDLKIGMKINLTVNFRTEEPSTGFTSGFANAEHRYSVIYKETDYMTLFHELSHFFGINDNPGYLDLEGNKDAMTYNYWWRRNESNPVKPLIQDNGGGSSSHCPNVIKAIRIVQLENKK